MKNIVERFIDPPYPYDFERGPDVVRTYDDARLGLNCTALAHLVLNEMHGESLPLTHKAFEMFTDLDRFRGIGAIADLEAGDQVWFGLANPAVPIVNFRPQMLDGHLLNWADCAVRHVGLFTGEVKEGDPLILHASRYLGKCAVEPLSEMRARPKHARIYGVRRFLSSEDRRKTETEVVSA